MGELDGQVEGLTIRHVRLRDIYGNLHTVPWSIIHFGEDKQGQASPARVKLSNVEIEGGDE